MSTSSVPETSYVPATDDHDSAMIVTYRGVSVTITLRSRSFAADYDLDPETVLVQVDTDPERDALPLSVAVNDDPVFEGVIR